MTLGQRVFIPLADQRGDSKHRRGTSDLFGLTIVRLILARKQRFSLGVSSSERRDEVIKILRPMKASRIQPLTCLALSHAGCVQRSDDFKTAHYVRILHKSDTLPLSDSWNHNEMSPCR